MQAASPAAKQYMANMPKFVLFAVLFINPIAQSPVIKAASVPIRQGSVPGSDPPEEATSFTSITAAPSVAGTERRKEYFAAMDRIKKATGGNVL